MQAQAVLCARTLEACHVENRQRRVVEVLEMVTC
jgi:hypothetical protein